MDKIKVYQDVLNEGHYKLLSDNLEIIKDDTHPYPIEIDLPKWTVQEDIDFRRWLLGFREGIVVESPAEFVDEIKLNILNLQGLYGIKK